MDVDAGAGAGADTGENEPPLLHYDSSASPAPSNIPCPLLLLRPLASPHWGRQIRSQDEHLAVDVAASVVVDSPLHFGYTVSPSTSSSPSLFLNLEAHSASERFLCPLLLFPHPLLLAQLVLLGIRVHAPAEPPLRSYFAASPSQDVSARPPPLLLPLLLCLAFFRSHPPAPPDERRPQRF